MSDNWSEGTPMQPESDDESVDWQSNGRGPDDGGGPAALTAPAQSATDAIAPGAATHDPAASSMAAPDSVAVATASDASVDEPAAFLAELARAMQATAGQERARVVEETDRRREEHIEHVRAREKAEAARMRELADEDMAAIDGWADAEIARIQAERERRAEALRADLATSLEQHRAQIAEEIARVETAIAGYRAEVDAFFDTLERQTDPVSIAQVATRRPAFPALDELTVFSATLAEPAEPATTAAVTTDDVTESAAEVAFPPSESTGMAEVNPDASASTEPAMEPESAGEAEAGTEEPLVAVMDDEARARLADSPWRDLPEHAAELAGIGEEARTTEANAEATEETAPDKQGADEPAAAHAPRRNSVLQAVPALRPMGSWLGRRGNSEGDEDQD